MKTLKGPGIFLAQFIGDQAPFNSLAASCEWAASLGYKGVQVPTWDARLIDLEKAATSDAYCDEIKGVARQHGVEITELSTHLQGQLVAVTGFPLFPVQPHPHECELEMGGYMIEARVNEGEAARLASLEGVRPITAIATVMPPEYEHEFQLQ